MILSSGLQDESGVELIKLLARVVMPRRFWGLIRC